MQLCRSGAGAADRPARRAAAAPGFRAEGGAAWPRPCADRPGRRRAGLHLARRRVRDAGRLRKSRPAVRGEHVAWANHRLSVDGGRKKSDQKQRFGMNIAIRPATLPHDYPAIAAVLKSDNSGAATADELAYDDAARDPRYYHASLVAEVIECGAAL